MEKRPCISSGQIFSMLFISKIVISMTYGSLLIGDSDIWDHLVSAVVSFMLTFLIIWPIYKLFSMDEKMNIMDNIYDLMGKCGMILIFIYVVYYLVICFHTVAVFNNFISNAVNPPISITFLTFVLIICACYGSYKGLEALARTSTFILISTIFSIVILGISLFSCVEPINFTPLMYSGNESVKEGVVYMISQSPCVLALAVLLPMGKGNKKTGIFVWNFLVYLLFAMIIILIIGSMGNFVYTQLFPVYTAAGIGKFGSFKHLDSLYLGVWISGIFLKLSLFFILASEGIKKVFGEKAKKISVVIFGIMMASVSCFPNFFGVLKSSVITWILFYFLIFLAVVVPCVLIFIKFLKLKRRNNIES